MNAVINMQGPSEEDALTQAHRVGGRGRAWVRAGIAVAAVGWGANQFAPLLLMYQNKLGLTPAVVQGTFALYALGLIPGLLLGGPFSDMYGRRRVMLPALAASALGTVALIAGGSALGWLFAGRLVSGIASGATFSSGTAWIKELSPTGPANGRHPGPRRATVTMTAGFAIGPLVSGVLAQWAPAPTVLPYLPHLALTLVAIALLFGTPETRISDGAADLRQRFHMPAVRERRFRNVVMPLAPWVFGSASIALAYLPGLVEKQLGGYGLVFSACDLTLAALSGILVQPFARRMDHPHRPRLLWGSMAIVTAGLLVGAAAAAASAPALVIVASLVLGAGYGCCQICGLLEVQRLAPPEDLAGLTAVYQALSYLGFTVPFLLAAARHVATPDVLLIAMAGLAAVTLAWLARAGTSE
jgi:MFS family permease